MMPDKSPLSLLEIVKRSAASEKLSLPVFPRAASELQKIIGDEKVSIDDIAAIIEKDQSLASQMLKLANSAFFSGLNRVRTIREAIMRLGLNQVFSCLVVSGQQNFYKSKDETVDRYLQVLWKHALAAAKGSKWLLQRIGYRDMADEGFLAGLLHDIGKLLLLKVIENINAEQDTRLSDAFVSEILDSLHVEQGHILMQEWSIPPVYCDIVRDHHLEEFDTGNVVLLAVRTVNQVCRRSGLSLNPDSRIVPATLPEAHALGVKEIVLAELEVVIEDSVELEFGT
ncbi:MAG: HDOD domain-containing protein [Desulfobacteraceae bacterium]|nr:HDOD domain-containing protein [Desulfobacteraceae bacterium]